MRCSLTSDGLIIPLRSASVIEQAASAGGASRAQTQPAPGPGTNKNETTKTPSERNAGAQAGARTGTSLSMRVPQQQLRLIRFHVPKFHFINPFAAFIADQRSATSAVRASTQSLAVPAKTLGEFVAYVARSTRAKSQLCASRAWAATQTSCRSSALISWRGYELQFHVPYARRHASG